MNHDTQEAADGLQQLARWRWVILVAVALAATVLAGGRGDWDFFVDAARGLFGDEGLSVYAIRRDIQSGPVTLVVARLFALTPRNGFVLASAVCVALGLYCVRTVERIAGRSGRSQLSNQLLTLVGGVCLLAWWGQFSGFGHLDDAIALTIAATVVDKRLAGRERWSPLLIGLAIATKPWAVFLLPLLLPQDIALRDLLGLRTLMRALAKPAVAVGVAAVCWLPFIIADAGTLDGFRPTVNLAGDSSLALWVSNSAAIPTWLRTAQLLLCLAIGVALMLRGRAVAVPLACIAMRVLVDPGAWAYYTPGIMLGALLLDARHAVRAWPLVTLLMMLLLAPASFMPSPTTGGVLRAAACFGAMLVAWSWPRNVAQQTPEAASRALQPL